MQFFQRVSEKKRDQKNRAGHLPQAVAKGTWPTVEADRAGFEPAVPLTGYAGLANRYLQPLGHLSVWPVCGLQQAMSALDSTKGHRRR